MTPAANTLYCIFLLFALASLHTWACRRERRLKRQRSGAPEPQSAALIPVAQFDRPSSVPHPQGI